MTIGNGADYPVACIASGVSDRECDDRGGEEEVAHWRRHADERWQINFDRRTAAFHQQRTFAEAWPAMSAFA